MVKHGTAVQLCGSCEHFRYAVVNFASRLTALRLVRTEAICV